MITGDSPIGSDSQHRLSDLVSANTADMYPASHEGVFYKLFFLLASLMRECRGAPRSSSKAELSLRQGTSLQTSHPAGQMSPPRARIPDGAASGGRHHPGRRRLPAKPDHG